MPPEITPRATEESEPRACFMLITGATIWGRITCSQLGHCTRVESDTGRSLIESDCTKDCVGVDGRLEGKAS